MDRGPLTYAQWLMLNDVFPFNSHMSSWIFHMQNVYSHNHQTTCQGYQHFLKFTVRFVLKGSKDNKIWSVMNTEEHDTPHKTFNWWFNALFTEDCCDSDGHMHLIHWGKLGMGLVVSYLSKINWMIGFPLDLVELKLQCLITKRLDWNPVVGCEYFSFNIVMWN
jgi:hypothetical protein